MSVLRIVSSAQRLLGQVQLIEVDEEHQVVQRKRKFSIAPPARTLVLGMLQEPNASARELATMAEDTDPMGSEVWRLENTLSI